jgi:NAD dependent epimerase/dehydratase family enzyme
MKVVIPGGSGQVGTILARAFHRIGDAVVVLSRRPETRPWRVVKWDGSSRGDWQRELDGCDAVINLAGRSVNCRYTAANRREILQSRVVATRLVGKAIADAARPPAVWLQASTATIYAHRFDAPNARRSHHRPSVAEDRCGDLNEQDLRDGHRRKHHRVADVGPLRLDGAGRVDQDSSPRPEQA